MVLVMIFRNIILNHQGFNVKEYFINPIIVIIFSFTLMYILKRLYLIITKYEDNIKKYCTYIKTGFYDQSKPEIYYNEYDLKLASNNQKIFKISN